MVHLALKTLNSPFLRSIPATPTTLPFRVRRSVIDEEIWPSPPLKAKIAPDTGSAIAFSDFTKSGVLAFPEVIAPIYAEINEIYGTNVEPIFKE